MKAVYLALIMSMIVMISCNSGNNSENINDTTKPTKFQNFSISDYIKKFQLVQLPFYFKGGNGSNIDNEKLFQIDKNSIDSLFFKGDNDDELFGYGLLSDTSKFYTLLYFGQAEDLYPILVTYSKKGRIISKETLIVHGCGSDCGLTYCSYSALLRKNLSIYLADTAKYKGICDSLGNFLPNSKTTFINSISGNIDSSGKIKLDKEKKEEIKNSL